MMGNSTLIRTTLLVALIIAIGFVATGRAPAGDPRETSAIQLVAGDATSRFIPLGVGKSVVVDLPRNIKDVLVADPTIANAVVRSARRAYIIGAKVGQTNVYFFDADGHQIGGLDIAVTRDLNGLRAALKRALPYADIHVEGLGDGLVLSGSVTNPMDTQTAFDIASRLVEDGKKVVNNITIQGRDQVMLKVTVAEVQRDVIKQLGIDLSGSVRAGTSVVNFNTNNVFSAFGQALSDTAIKAQQGVTANPITGALSPRVSATLKAMERAGVIRTLAEPTLTAISGENANFLVGGEFPVPGGYTCDTNLPPTCTQQIQFKKFGVSLNFTPVVMSGGRISLKVMTEVSEVSAENAIVLQPNSNALPVTIPSIKTRRADTTLEIPSGGSMALAGLIQEQTKQAINGIPGMMQLPILGTLFKSRDFVNRQTELAVIVTPYVVRAVAANKLSRPDDGFADSSDPSAVLLGRLNRIYGVANPAVPPGSYHGKYGFILD
jgi:pilus assembly protein CpaC